MKITDIEELKDFDINNELLGFLKKIYTFENILNNDDVRYLFLVSLISSDNSVNEKTANILLDKINFLTDNLKYMNISDSIRKETEKYLNKGKKILKKDIKEFKKNTDINNTVNTLEDNNFKSGKNGYEEGFDGITNQSFTF